MRQQNIFKDTIDEIRVCWTKTQHSLTPPYCTQNIRRRLDSYYAKSTTHTHTSHSQRAAVRADWEDIRTRTYQEMEDFITHPNEIMSNRDAATRRMIMCKGTNILWCKHIPHKNKINERCAQIRNQMSTHQSLSSLVPSVCNRIHFRMKPQTLGYINLLTRKGMQISVKQT